MYNVFINYLDEIGDSNKIRIVRHEDICLKPTKIFSDLYRWAGLEWSPGVESFIEELTGASNPLERSHSGKAHEYGLKRDSKNIVEIWKKRLTAEQIDSLKEIVNPTSNKFYSRETWKTGGGE
jgi:hypothetical protein